MKKCLPMLALVLAITFSSCQIGGTGESTDILQNASVEENANVLSTFDTHSSETYMDKLLSIAPWTENDILRGRFIDLVGDETANVLGNGQAFALVSDGAGMGKEGWSVVYTENGGADWAQDEEYFVEPLGYKDFVILENGMLLHFLFPHNYYGDDASPFRISDVQILTFNEETKNIDKEPVENWFDIFGLEDDLSYAVTYAHYLGNNMISVRIDEIIETPDEASDAENRIGKCLYYGNVVIDPQTMLPIQLAEIEEKKKVSDGSSEQESSQGKLSDNPINSTNALNYEQKLCTIDPWAIFPTERASGTTKEVTFLDLLIMDRANVVADGKAYAITYNESVGMSQTSGVVYYTENGGKDWENLGYYTQISGPFHSAALSDGRILCFRGPDRLAENQTPMVTVIDFDTQEIRLKETHINDWFEIFDTDKQIFISEISCVSSKKDVLTNGGFTLKLKLRSSRDDDSEILFDGCVVIDQENLKPIAKETQ